MTDKYNDIIRLPHPTSPRHPRMPIQARAAQFSPFAALNGHEAAILETARQTRQKIELSEDQKLDLDRRTRCLQPLLPHHPEVTVTYFVPDCNKDGGAYVTYTGHLRRIHPIDHTLYFTDGTTICPGLVLDLDSPHLKNRFDF